MVDVEELLLVESWRRNQIERQTKLIDFWYLNSLDGSYLFLFLMTKGN